MADLFTLPVDPDEGFPQAFIFAFGGATYGITWYVDIADAQLPAARVADPRMLIDVTGDGSTSSAVPQGILVLAVDSRGRDAVTTLLRRRVLPGLSYRAGQLLLVVNAAAVALGNLNGSGSFGSVLDVQVGAA